MDGTGIAVSVLPLALAVYWITGTVKDFTNRNYPAVVTRALAWAGGFAGVALVAHTRWASGVQLDSATTLAGLNWPEQIFLGLTLAAGGGTLNDTLRAVNQHDTSTLPTLVPPTVEETPAVAPTAKKGA